MQKRCNPRPLVSALLTIALLVSLMPTALAGQVDDYHDPAKHWMQAANRTNELDINSVVTHETFLCATCQKIADFTIFRVPEYTRTGETAMNRGVKYSNGICIDEVTQENLDTGIPGQTAYYTGYHWTKSVCGNCGAFNSNETP